MKVLCFLLALMGATVSLAAASQYKISSQLFVEGKLVSSPRIVALAGTPSELTQKYDDTDDKMKFKVIASDMSNEKIKDGILMQFEIEYVSGSRTIKVAPQVLAKSGSEATVTIGKLANQEEFLMKVTAIRE